MVVESVGRCWASHVGIVTLVDADRRQRLLLRVTPAESADVRSAVARRRAASVAVPCEPPPAAVYLIDQPVGAVIGVVLTIDGMGRRARTCRPVVAVLGALAARVALRVSERGARAVGDAGAPGSPAGGGDGAERVPAFHRRGAAGARRALARPWRNQETTCDRPPPAARPGRQPARPR
jgi:hypothetical protein